MNIASIKIFILAQIDKAKLTFKKLFVAEENDPKLVRRKHIRLGVIITVLFISVCASVMQTGTKKAASPAQIPQNKIIPNVSGISDLATGVSNEQTWTELKGKEVDELKNKQIEIDTKQQDFEEKVVKDKVSREEVAGLIMQLRLEMTETYGKKLEEEIGKIRHETEQKIHEPSLETKTTLKKKKIRRIGEYIPANSYAQAKLISGVDAGVGISSEANPRQTLIRITGEVVSAGIGSDYLKTNRLIGCLLSAKAVGDISSEKAYLDGVLMTCAVDKYTAIEVPVKAYITSNAKSGIRGEVVSREGDMVLKSFLSGLAGGFGNGISQITQPQMSLSGAGMLTTDTQKAKNILGKGIGSGASVSGDRLSEYFIKRAEQYQPVISINEGIEVYVVFQEGFSLKEGEQDEKTH